MRTSLTSLPRKTRPTSTVKTGSGRSPTTNSSSSWSRSSARTSSTWPSRWWTRTCSSSTTTTTKAHNYLTYWRMRRSQAGSTFSKTMVLYRILLTTLRCTSFKIIWQIKRKSIKKSNDSVLFADYHGFEHHLQYASKTLAYGIKFRELRSKWRTAWISF